MQPQQAEALGVETRSEAVDRDRSAIAGRRRALERLRGAVLDRGGGPALITGEPGAGKSWLAGRLIAGLPPGWRAATVEIATALDGLELLRLIGDAVGVAMPDRLGAARLSLSAALRAADADGRSWLLIVDEAQRCSAGAWEELQALANRLGGADGFAAMVLLARTELARDLAARRLDGWANRLGLHLHLPPLDLDEAGQLLESQAPGVRLSGRELEEVHRDAMGNPRTMLQLVRSRSSGRPSRRTGLETSAAGRQSPALGPLPAPSPAAARMPGGSGESIRSLADDLAEPDEEDDPEPPVGFAPPRPPALIPARPPIRVEDGLVEVGWEGDLEVEPLRGEPAASDADSGSAHADDRDEQVVEDRYAALQAWAEWARNRERAASPAADSTAAAAAPAPGSDDDRAVFPAESARPVSEPSTASIVRAETPHEFAPYGQLFTRLRHSS